ncbi:hypothetical protein HMPREF9412_2812 [Paenibacillus sp. HGF5]|nr:hypothetical protein HMPREF9412_2812 [Paenibacillus sp. HGF5]
MKMDISVQSKLLPRMIEVHGGSFLHASLEVWFESGTPRCHRLPGFRETPGGYTQVQAMIQFIIHYAKRS